MKSDFRHYGYVLDSATEIRALYPDEPWAAMQELRSILEPGVQVQLIFEPLNPKAYGVPERMWVTVVDSTDALFYVGTLNDTPAMIEGLCEDDTVYFEIENILNFDFIGQ